ncbi:MAG: acetoacetate--CoA ligase [Trueperaceae bacterium]
MMMQPLWTPSSEHVTATNLSAFMSAASSFVGQPFSTYADLHAWSIKDVATFWKFYAEYVGLDLRESRSVLKGSMPSVRWFEGAKLNYAEHLLFPGSLQNDQHLAIIALTETGDERVLSYGQLREDVFRCAAALQREGVGVGDRVAAFAANVPETVILLLACASLGAIFSSCSPDFGLETAISRFQQIEPKLLFASESYNYAGKHFNVRHVATELAKTIPSIRQVVFLPSEAEVKSESTLTWHDWLEPTAQPFYEPLEFNHPLYILYSSGTTGLPKAMIHRAGGVLLQHHKEQYLHCDIKPGDKVLYYTTCSWMMWNWLVSVLAQGATIVLYEGSPAYPTLGTLWQHVEKHGLTFFGTSARYLHSLQAANFSGCSFDLSSLKTIASTGSPLSPSAFEYVYKTIKHDVHLASISGGTDIVSCFMLGVPTESVYAGQIQGPGLGVDLAAFDSVGRAVTKGSGELVCRQPLPSMPLGFWNDPEDQRFREAYFEQYPGVWRHGDFIEVSDQGGIIIYGRSDATLNPSGVRIGTAEIYRPLEGLPEILEACAVGKKEAGDEVIWLFVVLQEGLELDDALRQMIQKTLRSQASPKHVPKKIFGVSQLPRTRNGKLMEDVVSRLINGREIVNHNVIVNPGVLEEIAAVAVVP